MEDCFREFWTDNADRLSMLYSGTGALKVDFTRTGKRSRAGAFEDGKRAITRYFINNFYDTHNQNTLDFVLGKVKFGELNGMQQHSATFTLIGALAVDLFDRDAYRALLCGISPSRHCRQDLQLDLLHLPRRTQLLHGLLLPGRQLPEAVGAANHPRLKSQVMRGEDEAPSLEEATTSIITAFVTSISEPAVGKLCSPSLAVPFGVRLNAAINR